jgi:hypothetical protein
MSKLISKKEKPAGRGFESLRAHHFPRVECGLPNFGNRAGPRFNSRCVSRGMLEKSRLGRVLSDRDVNRWHANLAERSELTADIYTRRLDRFCEEFETTPGKLWGLDSKSACTFLVDAVGSIVARS